MAYLGTALPAIAGYMALHLDSALQHMLGQGGAGRAAAGEKGEP